MGTADIIPGVSGGTVAFITGIYQNLLDAIASFNQDFFKNIFLFKFKKAISLIPIKFLIPLAAGIFTAIISTAQFMHFLMKYYPLYTWSLFFGLICSSVVIVYKEINNTKNSSNSILNFTLIIIGIIFSYFVVGFIPIKTTNASWFIFLSGFISICAMILPGLSGAFILLILGKYYYVTTALKNPFDLENISIILTFVCGAAMGLLSFSRVLQYFLKNYRSQTIAILTGFMIGALRKVWPWKEIIETKIIRGKTYIIQEMNIWPPEVNTQFYISLSLIITGFCLVIFIEKIAKQQKKLSL